MKKKRASAAAAASSTIPGHTLPGEFLQRSIQVHLVGVGGNGSKMLAGLAQLHAALRGVGHPGGLEVTAWDPDLVSAANVGRQLFSPADIGQSKSEVSIHRINSFFGTDWHAQDIMFDADETAARNADIIVTCTDTLESRWRIHQRLNNPNQPHRVRYWLDCGNTANSGQVVLGQPAGGPGAEDTHRLPTITELFHSHFHGTGKGAAKETDNLPSCSLAEALHRQDLFINHHVSGWALHLLWSFFRHGSLRIHGYFINLATGRTVPMDVDPAEWDRLGFDPAERAPLRKIVEVLVPRKGLFQAAKVKLSCGHTTNSNGAKEARCIACLNGNRSKRNT